LILCLCCILSEKKFFGPPEIRTRDRSEHFSA
jgi:hypothetical protein